MSHKFPITKSTAEWKAKLSPQQFAVLRESNTERPFSKDYIDFNKSKEQGIFNCAGCGNPLYKSSTKFDAHCGWPAFYEAIPGSIKLTKDGSLGMERIEMACDQCGGHLGHVFKGEGFNTPTNERHCVNLVSLKFKPDDEQI